MKLGLFPKINTINPDASNTPAIILRIISQCEEPTIN